MIPKIIHQIFYPIYLKEMPQSWKNNAQKWKEMHPDWNYKLWNLDESLNLLQNHYPWFVKTWLNYKHPIQRCDTIRFFILYHYGGLYVDLDEYPLKPFDNLLEYSVLLPQSAYSVDGVSNFLIASSPGHPFIKMCIDNLEANKENKKWLGKHFHVMCSTGPLFLTNRLKEYSRNDIFVIASKNVRGSCEYCSTKGDHCVQGVLLGSEAGKSWNSWDSIVLTHFYCYYREYIILILVLVLILIIYFIFIKKCRMVCKK